MLNFHAVMRSGQTAVLSRLSRFGRVICYCYFTVPINFSFLLLLGVQIMASTNAIQSSYDPVFNHIYEQDYLWLNS